MLTIRQQKIVKFIAYAIQIALIVTIITLSCVISNRNVKYRSAQSQVKALTEQVDSLTRINKALGAEVCYTVNCTINLTSKNIMGVNTINSNNIAKTVATTTRQELFALRDSLENKPMK